jgi:hypothetical protein
VLHNNPDARSPQDEDSYKKFQGYMSTLLEHGADFQTMTVMTPFGDPFQFDTTTSPAPAVSYKLTDILGAADETSVHVGRELGKYQLFRRWDDQLVLCYAKAPIAGVQSAAPDIQRFVTENQTTLETLVAGGLDHLNSGKFAPSFLAMAKGGGKNGGGQGGGGSPQGPGGSPKGGGPAGASTQISSPVLPLAAMLPSEQCAQLEYVADALGDERQIARDSAKDVQFRLKSVQDVIEYLGAMLRKNPLVGFTSDPSTFFSLAATKKGTPYDRRSRIDVDYADGSTYHVSTDDKDYTSEVLGILTELINARKLSSDIATTKQVQVIP